MLGLFSNDRQKFCAVDNVSFQIKEGEFVGYLGPNGAGKMVTYIAVPHHLHYQVLKQLSDRGVKKFILEKPLADNQRDVAKIVNLRDKLKLHIVVNEQYAYSVVHGIINDYMAKNDLTPVLGLSFHTKDRRFDTEYGRNVESTNIFLFDMFHQVWMANHYMGRSRVVEDQVDDMRLRTKTVSEHRRGLLILRGTEHPAMDFVSICLHEKSGSRLIDRFLNIYARDAWGRFRLIRASFGFSGEMDAHIDVIDENKCIELLDNGGIWDGPLDHSFYYSIYALSTGGKVPAELEEIVKVHEIIEKAWAFIQKNK